MSHGALQDLNLAGVRWELSETPITSTSNTQKTAQTVQNPTQSIASIAEINRAPTSVVPPIAPVQTISQETVNAMAARPNDIPALIRMIGEFNHPLRTTATNTVLPHIANNPNGLVLITDIPSSDDDASGNILSGTTGELMDKMLAAIGTSRENVSIIPMLFWRTPGGRTPNRIELDMTRPFIDRLIGMLNPRIILTMGSLPATEIAGVNLAKEHGKPVTIEGKPTIVPIYHPNYLILKPTAKRDVWNALQNVQNILKSA